MTTITYQCPCCGAPLAYSAKSGKLECASCGNDFELDALEAMNAQSESTVKFEKPTETIEDAQGVQGYICQNCGANLLTEETTTATECPYCGSPIILSDHVAEGILPQKVVPFKVTKQEAQGEFENYFKGKRLIPNIFLNGRNRIADMRKLYVPYWLYDCDAHADMVYDAEKRRTTRDGDWEIETTEHWVVRRSGDLGFENIPVDSSVKMDNKITESIEPYDLAEAVDFETAVLSGALADNADADEQECEQRATERVKNSIAAAMRSTVNGYSIVTERSRAIVSRHGKATPVLLPVWMITTEKEGKTYTFAINGQTGRLTCDVPTAKGKAFGWGFGIFAGVFALEAMILYFMEMMESSAMLMAAVLAMVIALVIVSGMIGKLKQAASQSEAKVYVREGSFDVQVSRDTYMYETTQRRRIEKSEDDKK